MKMWKVLGTVFFLSFVGSASFMTLKGFVGENAATISNETTASNYTAVGNDTAASNETEPQKIARKMVEQEMSKQVGLKKWEITFNKVTSDNNVNNVADYDKPVGDKRVVWIEGNVKATTKDGTTGNIGYTLELYQMKGDSKWYIDNHTGVLANLVTEKPNVKEDERLFSNNETIVIDKEKGGLASSNVPNYGETFEEANPAKASQQTPSQLDPNDEKGVYNAVVSYENARIKAINSGDFEILKPYLLPGSFLAISDQKEINSLYSQGITAHFNMLNIESIQKVDVDKFEAKVYEEITLQDNKISRWVYTVQKYNGQYLLSYVKEANNS